MLFGPHNDDHTKPKLRAWAVLLLIALIVGMTYLVLRKDPGNPPPVPTPNFNSGNEHSF
jgi:hypothetical protein